MLRYRVDSLTKPMQKYYKSIWSGIDKFGLNCDIIKIQAQAAQLIPSHFDESQEFTDIGKGYMIVERMQNKICLKVILLTVHAAYSMCLL